MVAAETPEPESAGKAEKGGCMKLDPRIFPTILMVLDFIAAVPYMCKGDVKMTVYWIAAGVLTLAVTWL